MRRAFVGAISAVARCIPRSLAAAACCRCGAGVLTMAEASVDLPTILLLTFLVLLIALVTISYEVAVRQLHRVRRPPCHHGSSRALTRNASARSQLFRRYRLPPVFLAKMFEELAKLGLISFVLAILGSLELFEQVRLRSLLATRSRSLSLTRSSAQNTEDLIANVHLILFAMGVAYVMLVAAILAGSVLWTRRYSILELRCADSSRTCHTSLPRSGQDTCRTQS